MMEGITMQAIGELLNTFGAWGLCGVLLWERFTVGKAMTDALNKFTVALEVLCKSAVV